MGLFESSMNAVKGALGKDNQIQKEDKGDDLINKLEALYREAKRNKKELLKVIEDNKKQYLGKHWSDIKRPSYKSDVVVNYQYMATETVTPIITDRQPKLLAMLKKGGDEELQDQADDIGDFLDYQWERNQMPLRTPEIVRHMLVYRDAILYPYWNYYEDDVDVDIVNPRYIYIDPKATKDEDIEYFVIAIPRSVKYVKEYAKQKGKELSDEDLAGAVPEKNDMEDGDKQDRENMILFKEFWGYMETDGEYIIKKICWVGNHIISNERDPNYDYEGEVTQEAEINELGETIGEEQRKYHNHFKYPKLPLIIAPTFRFGETLLSETSQVEQTKKLQDAINKRKAQIEDNANLMANPIWLLAKDSGIDTNDLSNIPNSIVEGVDISPDKVRRESGVGLPNYVFNDLESTQRTFDNIWGTHDISKGGKLNVQSATEAQLLKEADQGRIALLIRNFNRAIEELGNWWVQLMKVNYTETHYGRVINKGQVERFIQVSRDNIPDEIDIIIKAGSTMPIDRVQERQENIDMFNSGALDPITFYERLEDINNPEEKARMLDAWRKGVMFPENQPPAPPGMEGGEAPPEEEMPQGEMPPEMQAELEEEELPEEI